MPRLVAVITANLTSAVMAVFVVLADELVVLGTPQILIRMHDLLSALPSLTDVPIAKGGRVRCELPSPLLAATSPSTHTPSSTEHGPVVTGASDLI